MNSSMSFWVRSRRFAAFASVVAVAAVGVIAADRASADVVDHPIVLAFDQTGSFTDSGGRAITIVSDSRDPGLREIVGLEATGAAVQINLYSKSNSTPAAPQMGPVEPAQSESANSLSDYSVVSETKNVDDIPLDASTLVQHMASGVTASTATIAWNPAGAPGPFDVFRDDVKVATVTDPTFMEEGLTPDAPYQYRIAVQSDTNADPSIAVSDFSVTLPLQTLASQDAATPSSKRESEAKSLVASAARLYDSPTEFVYGTFIPNARVGGIEVAACTMHPGDEFTGDGRSYRMPDGSDGYRSAMWAGVNWGTGKMQLNKWVNPSQLIRGGKVVSTQRASTNEMYFEGPRVGSSVATVEFNHRSGNPHCAIGAITYDVVVTFWRNGLVDVTGWRYPVPNHEGWVRWTAKGYQWHNAFKHNNEGFVCLIGICGSRSVNAALRP